MNRFLISRTIDAPIDFVFKTVADIREFSKVLPHVIDYEFLTDQQSGVGTRFRETRMMHGKTKAVTELEVTEYVENNHVRLLADSHGAVWDTVFEVKEKNGATVLTMTMDAKAYKLMAKIMNRLFKGMIRKAIENDMDLVKAYCENPPADEG